MKYSNLPAHATLAQLCLSASDKFKDGIAFSMITEGEINRQITYSQMGSLAKQVSSTLRNIGVKKGDRVLLLSDNCPEWPIAYFGISVAGAVSVPLLTGFSPEQVQHIIEHSGVRAICISRDMAQKLEGINLSHIPFIYLEDIKEDKTISKEITETQAPDDLATIIYTSGTQGNSKGVMLSSKNIISSSVSSLTYVQTTPKDRLLSVLPLAHSYECSLGFLASVLGGSNVTYLDKPPSPSVLLPALKLIRPTVMISVPLLIEKVYNNGIAPKLRKNPLYKFPLTRPLAVLVAGRKLIAALGGKIRFYGIGGAPLSPHVEKFLYNARFPYAMGYGLTEAAPLVAGMQKFRPSLKTGITTPDGVTMRIENDEIQVTGPNVMLGYYNDAERTAEVMTSDGWLRTGDIGQINKKGELHIKGRLKALILGPSGENIYPEEIENLLGSSQLVEESLVYSGKRGELIALVRLSEAAKAAAGILEHTSEAAKAAAGVIEHTLEDLRTWVNKKLAAFSRISKIEIMHEPFEKTPTMKIKRYLYV
ncbi:MAG: AMP-binding protein [Treponema sp.]|nr:AMP-binding protein [Treponema sp.]